MALAAEVGNQASDLTLLTVIAVGVVCNWLG